MIAPPIDDDDDNEEDDEDYVPGQDKDEMDEDDDLLQGEATPGEVYYTPSLSLAKRKAVDDAFETLFGYKFGTSLLPVRKLRRRNVDKQLDILEGIFGPTRASQILSSHIRPVRRLPLPSTLIETITEIKHYAGKSIVVKRKVESTGAMNGAATAANPPVKPSGLDTLLQELDGPSKLSTVAKTSADWDQFKTNEGLEEDLTKQAQGKNAFLQKKDFLQRVDARRFEVEKKVREAERTTRGK